MSLTRGQTLALVLGLLGLAFLVRSQNLTLQFPYIDEGFHSRRAAMVWDFETHPGRFSHGKLLVYFWLGLFEAPPPHFLLTGRMSIALFSLLSAAGVYATGRLLANTTVGLVALALYAVFPFAVFFERMMMADPFASAFIVLLAWRSLIFARRPRWHEGLLMGLLLTLATLAKLTAVLSPLLPVSAALFYGVWAGGVGGWARRYIPPLALAAVTLIFLWLPVLIPAALAHNTDEPFKLVNPFNVSKDERSTPPVYVERISREIGDFLSRPLMLGLAGASLGALALGLYGRRWCEVWALLWLVLWLFSLSILPIMAARLPSSRYFMPLSAPLVLLMAWLAWQVWGGARRWGLVRGAGYALIGLWLVLFALPFVESTVNAPWNLPFRNTNATEYSDGILMGELSAQRAAREINALDPAPEHVYITWNLCHLMYLYLERDVTCLSLDTPLGDLRRFLPRDLGPDEEAYIVISDYREPFFQRIEGLGWQDVASIIRQTRLNRSIRIWKIFWRAPPTTR